MASMEFIALIVTGLGIAASIIYYASVLKNANTARQASLFTSIQNRMDSPEFWLSYRRIVYDTMGKTYEERMEMQRENNFERYGDLMSLISFFQHVGWLVRKGLLDIDAMMSLPSVAINVHNAVMPSLKEYERRTGRGQKYRDFDYLVEEIQKRSLGVDTFDPEKVDEEELPKKINR